MVIEALTPTFPPVNPCETNAELKDYQNSCDIIRQKCEPVIGCEPSSNEIPKTVCICITGFCRDSSDNCVAIEYTYEFPGTTPVSTLY